VPKLNGGESYHSKVTIRALVSRDEVQTVVTDIRKLQQAKPEVVKIPFRAD
jgi:hypothetical protein